MMNMMSTQMMVGIMIVSSLLSTMTVWADKLSDIRWSLNDLYMSLLMSGWMVLFMGMYDKNKKTIILGIVFIVAAFICIRKQIFVNESQFYKGMIPHHSMAVHMSKELIKKNGNMGSTEFAQSIINNQNREIDWMKQKLL